jgi:hypothetical protein
MPGREVRNMPDENIFLSTIYGPTGKLVGFEVGVEVERLKERAPVDAKAFGPDFTFKLWECKEIPVKK